MADPSDNSSAIESDLTLNDAIKANIVPFQEYFLHGSILDSEVDSLLERLKGLCDNVSDEVETFEDHEICFIFYRNYRVRERPMRLRMRRSLKHEDQPYLLRYVGITDAGDVSQPTAVRTCIDVGTSNNVIEFLMELGYRKEYEFAARGYLFKKGRLKCTVSKIHRAKEINGEFGVHDPFTGSHFVEMSIVVPAGRETVGHEIKLFADCLKPLVYMRKTDYGTI